MPGCGRTLDRRRVTAYHLPGERLGGQENLNLRNRTRAGHSEVQHDTRLHCGMQGLQVTLYTSTGCCGALFKKAGGRVTIGGAQFGLSLGRLVCGLDANLLFLVAVTMQMNSVPSALTCFLTRPETRHDVFLPLYSTKQVTRTAPTSRAS